MLLQSLDLGYLTFIGLTSFCRGNIQIIQTLPYIVHDTFSVAKIHYTFYIAECSYLLIGVNEAGFQSFYIII